MPPVRIPDDGDRGSVAPGILFPILGLVEKIDRWLRRIRPIRPGVSVVCLEMRRHRGGPVTLADGTTVRPGDLAPVIHFDNRRLRELASERWQTRAAAVARDDLRALATQQAALPAARRAVAFTGASVLAPLARRMGFELRPRRRSPWVQFENWYLRSLLARWSLLGSRRFERGRRPLVSQRGWLSASALQRRWGPPVT